MDYRCSGGRCSFEIKHRADSSKVTDMHEARTGKMSDVIGEAKVLVKNYTYVAYSKVWSECVSRCRVKVKGFSLVGIFFSCSRRPMSINSVFEGFRQRRFEVIQKEIYLTTCRR